jgi:hypothetical protein
MYWTLFQVLQEYQCHSAAAPHRIIVRNMNNFTFRLGYIIKVIKYESKILTDTHKIIMR